MILVECLLHTMGYKIVETLSSSGVISEIDPPPSPFPSIQSWSVCCFLEEAQTVVKQCMETRRVGEGKASFSLLSPAKSQRGEMANFRRISMESW